MYFAATSYNIYSNTKSIMEMEYLTKKFFVVQTPKINLKSQPTIMEPSKLVTLLLLYRVAFSVATVENLFFPFLHNELFFHKSQIKNCSNHLRIVRMAHPINQGDYAYSFVSLKRKNFISVTPLKAALNALILALNDSAKALVAY